MSGRTETTPRPQPGPAVLRLASAASFMVVLDTTIINIALPSMRRALHLTPTGQQWIVNAYILAFGGFLLLGGRAGDLFGRRRTFLIGLSVFTLASFAGGIASSGALLIIARSLQGFGGAVLSPSTLGLLSTTYHDARYRNKAFATWNASSAVGAAAGIVLGGLLTGTFGWRSVMFVNVPVGVALLVFATRHLPRRHRTPGAPPLDYAGAVAVTLGSSVFVYAIVTTTTHGWTSPTTISLIVVAAAILAMFVLLESRVRAPLVPLSFFRNRTASSANALAILLGIVGITANYFASLYLQQVRGESPLHSGLILVPATFGAIGGALVMGRVQGRIGIRLGIFGGALIAAVGLFALSQSAAKGTPLLLALTLPALVTSAGSACIYVPLTMAATASVPPALAGLAAGMVSSARQLGSAVGLAVFVTAAASATAAATGPRTAPHALVTGYDLAFLLDGVVAVCCGLLALLLLPRQLGRVSPNPVAPVTPVAA